MSNAPRADGHRWLKTSADGRCQYVSGLVHGLQRQTANFEAAIETDLLVGLDLPAGTDPKELAAWGQRVKTNIGLPPELGRTTISQLVDAFDRIYGDERNLSILIVSALPAALAIIGRSPQGTVRECLKRLRTDKWQHREGLR